MIDFNKLQKTWSYFRNTMNADDKNGNPTRQLVDNIGGGHCWHTGRHVSHVDRELMQVSEALKRPTNSLGQTMSYRQTPCISPIFEPINSYHTLMRLAQFDSNYGKKRAKRNERTSGQPLFYWQATEKPWFSDFGARSFFSFAYESRAQAFSVFSRIPFDMLY